MVKAKIEKKFDLDLQLYTDILETLQKHFLYKKRIVLLDTTSYLERKKRLCSLSNQFNSLRDRLRKRLNISLITDFFTEGLKEINRG